MFKTKPFLSFAMGLIEANPRGRWITASILFLGYFPLFLIALSVLGNVALAVVFVPTLFWAVALRPRFGFLGSLLLMIPNYFILIALEAMQTSAETLQLGISHIVIGLISYIVGYSYELRRNLSMELAERQKSDARFRGLFENTNDAVFFMDPELVVLALNNRAARMLGYSETELVGMDFRRLVVATEQSDLEHRLQQIRSGAPLPIYERNFRCKDGSVLTAEVNASLILAGDEYHIQSVCRDITERKAAESDLFYRASHDGLTGLYNRAMFFSLLTRAVDAARRLNHPLAVLFLDLDGFKNVNDSFGHALGDLVLKSCAGRLKGRLRSTDVVARIGGDEFAVLLDPISEKAFALHVAESIELALAEPFIFDGVQMQVSTSVGIGMFPQEAHDADGLVRLADQNMYTIKQKKTLASVTPL